jgi:hypothetical protein
MIYGNALVQRVQGMIGVDGRGIKHLSYTYHAIHRHKNNERFNEFFLPKSLQNGKKFCIFALHLKKLFTCSLAGNMALNGGPTLRASETPLICQPGTNVKPFLIYI